jgi:hypothetical protein
MNQSVERTIGRIDDVGVCTRTYMQIHYVPTYVHIWFSDVQCEVNSVVFEVLHTNSIRACTSRTVAVHMYVVV